MQAIIFMTLVAAAVAMPYGVDNGWGAPAIAHAPAVAYAQPALVKQVQYQPQYVHAAPAVVKQVQYQPQYVHAAPAIVKAVAPAATSYSTFSQTHVSHPAPIVKVAQPVHYAQPQFVKQVVAQPVVQSYVHSQPAIYGHASYPAPAAHGW